MPAIAEKIYARLMKDPDLDIPYGLTREEFARKEADARERQHRNNAEALSLFKEEIEADINSYKMQQNAKKFYQHGLNADIYNSLPLEAQEKIDKVFNMKSQGNSNKFKVGTGENKIENLIGLFFQNAKNILQSETDVDFGSFEATDEIKNVLNDVYTNLLDEPIFKDDNQMKMYTNYNQSTPSHQETIQGIVKELNPESKIEPPASTPASDPTPANEPKQTLQDTTSPDAPQSVDDLLADGVAPKPKNLDTDSFKREDVPYSTYMQGGKAHQLASQYGLTDADGSFNSKGHALINYAKKNGLKTTKSFSPKEIKYTKDKKYVLNEKSVQELVNFYEEKTSEDLTGDTVTLDTANTKVPKGLKGGLTLAELKANPDLVEGLNSSEIKDAEKIQSESAKGNTLSSGQTVEEKLKEIQNLITDLKDTEDEDEPTETEQLEEEQDIESFEAGEGQSEVDDEKQKIIDKAEKLGLIDYIHEVIEGHSENDFYSKEDTIKELKEKKDLSKYLSQVQTKQKKAKEAEEAKQQKTEEAQAAKEEAAKAKEEAAQEKAKLKEMKDEAKAVPQFEDAENMNHHAMNLVHHLSKYKDYMSAKEKKALAQSLSDTFDSDKTPVKGKVADKEFINDHMNEVGYENLGGDDHQEEIDYYATHSEHVEEQYEKLHSNEDGMQSKKDAFESKDHNAHTNFDDDGNPTGGHTTKVHDGEGKVTDFADNSSKFDSGHDGIHHLNHELDDNQKFDFEKYKEAMKAGDTEAAEVYKKDLIDSGIPKQAFDGEGSGGFDDKYPDPEVAKKKLAEGYVFNEATRHWILRENLEGAQGGMGAHDAEVHSSSSTNEKGQAFALNPDGTPHEGNFMVSSAGVHKLGDSHDAAPSKSAGMTMGQTKSNALSHAFSNSSLGKKHQAGGVTKLKGALHPKGSASAVFSGKSGGLLHGTGLEHAKNSGLTSQSYKTAQTKKQASKAKSQAEVKSAAVDASKQIGKYSALGYSPQVAKFLGKVGKNLAAKVKKIKQAKAPEPKMSAKELKASQAKVKSIKDKVSKETGTGKVEKSLDKFNEFIRKTKV